MEQEKFTFVTLTHSGHRLEERYMTRAEANARFDFMVAAEERSPEGLAVAYYCASVGGLVNAWSAPK